MSITSDYFNAGMRNRERLRWTLATRRQLERWEPLVAAFLLAKWARQTSDDPSLWAAEAEHHFALVAAHHLFQALDLERQAARTRR